MSRALRAAAAAWLAADAPAIVVAVEATRGSAPRDAGARMLVGPERIAGTIGGGHLELKAIAAARAMLAAGDLEPRRARYALGPSLGQCCGGAVELAWRPLDEAALAEWPLEPPLFRLQLHGAGHVGRALATLLATLDVEVDWHDARDDGFAATTTLGSPWPAHVRRHADAPIEAAVAAAPPETLFVVLTHEHALDLRIVEAVLQRGAVAFCGLIGSRSKAASFASRLLARGVDEARLERLTCPIGAPSAHGKDPAVIAAGVLAQLIGVAAARTAERRHAATA